MITATDVMRQNRTLVPLADNGQPLDDAAAETMRKINFWVERANRLDGARFNERPDYCRVLYVMHQITKAPIDLAGANLPRAAKTKAWKHPWSGTKPGEQLIGALRSKF